MELKKESENKSRGDEAEEMRKKNTCIGRPLKAGGYTKKNQIIQGSLTKGENAEGLASKLKTLRKLHIYQSKIILLGAVHAAFCVLHCW